MAGGSKARRRGRSHDAAPTRIVLPHAAFPGDVPELERLIAEAKRRGFRERWADDPHCAMAEKLFYSGGKVLGRADVARDDSDKARVCLRCVLGSFQPSHEDKIAVAGMIIADYLEVVG